MDSKTNFHPPKGWTKARIFSAALSFLLVGGAITIFFCAKPILFVEAGPQKADVIIVLGGDAGDRAFRALELYRQGAAPRILISGSGDCFLIHDRLALAGIPQANLFIESKSRNTEENAMFSSKWMHERGLKSAIIVTSWFHSRRAISCFEHSSPDIRFSSLPSYHGLNMNRKPSYYETPYVFREYCALCWYFVRYGVTPRGVS